MAFALGRYDQFWVALRSPAIVISTVSALCAIAFTDPAIIENRGIINTQIGSHFESSLVLAPLLAFGFVCDAKPFRITLFIVVCFLCEFVYIYFGRRGVSVECALQILVLIFLSSFVTRRQLIPSLLLILFIVGLAKYYSFEPLTSRFQSSSSVMETITVDNERIIELTDMISQFNTPEIIYGRGFGGSYIGTLGIEDLITGDVYGRIVCHSSVANAILKGGCLLCLTMTYPLWLLFYRSIFQHKRESISYGIGFASIIFFIFSLSGGGITYSTPFQTLAVGLILSRIQVK